MKNIFDTNKAKQSMEYNWVTVIPRNYLDLIRPVLDVIPRSVIRFSYNTELNVRMGYNTEYNHVLLECM